MEEEQEDLDQLLDEVEKKFCRHVPSSSGKKEQRDTGSASKQSAAKPVESISSFSEDIDAFLEELLEEEDGGSQQEKRDAPSEAGTQNKALPLSGGRRCCPVFIGGSRVTNGVGTATSKRSCDQLRCVSCDFKVLMFDDCEWDASCDYLFLRNNMPEVHRLGSKLKKRRGFRSYACQCSWFSTSSSEPTQLGVQTGTTWVCGRHHN